ncbi:ABC transporter substrate-binding protein [Labrys wisconsinensis]|uniref:ABC transporter substrate binding protein (PQQ-dependent alcohol dehydrogenase system) n=1 Tax=Labrys wisconsinensis TaxID=425677 RepID=A0ABU0IYI4_9HYPH|nr:ABC transporter substrate-binding protein [Labrys wisconsinensis]MDQ0467077.1 ABC transporter substrate binding protein (PQQ-dependent alcohol dehydrogenase system) [Labrys wisconsinensis]
MLPTTRFLRFLPGLALASVLALAGVVAAGAATVKTEVGIGIIGPKSPPPPLYELDPVPQDEALAGARQAIIDDNTTGSFLGQHYTLNEVVLTPDQSPVDAARKLADGGVGYLVLNLPADQLLAVADALKGRPVVLFNVGAPDDRLRAADCRANIFHVLPNRGMLTDALAEFLATRKWPNLFLITGPGPGDKLYAEAMRRSAKKFGLKIAADTDWTFGPLAKARADSVVTADALVFTRGTDYDVMVVADEAGDFGDFIAYNTWDPKLVAGTQGLVPTAWHRAQDAWGSAQLQSRFYKTTGRFMRPADYAAWVAVRAVGEAVTRAKSADPKTLADFMLTPKFQIAAFKGVPVSFRTWDHQLRQPVLLAQPMRIVSVSPQQGFLHQKTPLDTLGFDEPENACSLK